MSKYETTIKVAQIQRLVEERKYKKAAAVLGTMDVRQIRSRADLHTFAEVYMKTEQFEAAKAIYLRLYKRNRTRRILYRLIYLAIRTNELEEAENFYDEFLNLSNSSRDNLILRYRLDKAKGVPISQLIETLEILKDEEYIEEWAYELAKLYQKAGRVEDCRQECQDIKLWFGQGEIVERAEQLIAYLDGDEQLYYEDRDYTEKNREEPNPDDTGSLPDLSPEALRREKERLKQKKKEEKAKREAARMEEDPECGDAEEQFVDDYEEEHDEDEGEMLMEPGELAQMAKEGLMKLSGFWKRSNKPSSNEMSDKEAANGKASEKTMAGKKASGSSESEKKEKMQNDSLDKQENPVKESQSGMGITKDLAKEIAAIFEAEHREQLKEKAVAVTKEKAAAITDEVAELAGEVPNMAVNVVDRMSQAMQNKTAKKYIPLDVETVSQVQPEGMEEIVESENKRADDAEPETVRTNGTAAQEISKDDMTLENQQKDEDEITMIELDKIMPEPDMPELKQVIPEDSPELGNQPELEEQELPTTRALHHSFDDILTLIAGEREPKHFVLMGEGEEKILGITKQIVRVMNRKGFLSTNQIARIYSEQLNEMDLLRVCNQIKGSCLLIDGAAQLLFPTITKIFAVMDAFHGDFVVVLADEGNTLDDLFRVAPALARRFEYVIDIDQYDETDYQ
ncbi:MAG: hypothetical protein J5979_05975 [Lachnospiraceae bacterium]|nr:hypothetical protein [Lachnospiraceae bacterium]